MPKAGQVLYLRLKRETTGSGLIIKLPARMSMEEAEKHAYEQHGNEWQVASGSLHKPSELI